MVFNRQTAVERRRGGRIVTSLWIEVIGIDESPRLRKGNISISGIFIDLDRSPGDLGTVCQMRIGGLERGPFIKVMARLTRVVSYQDLQEGHVIVGAAFEYLTKEKQLKDSIIKFIKKAAEYSIKKAQEIDIDCRAVASVTREQAFTSEANIKKLTLNGMTVETNWPIEPNETIHIAMDASASKLGIRFTGRVRQTKELGTDNKVSYLTDIQFNPDPSSDEVSESTSDPNLERPLSSALDGFLSEVIAGGDLAESEDADRAFRGMLNQVSVASLLNFMQMEKMTGKLAITYLDGQALLFVVSGQLIDMEVDGNQVDVRKALFHVLDLKEGSFDFIACALDRKDRVGASTTAFLLDIIQQKDEESR